MADDVAPFTTLTGTDVIFSCVAGPKTATAGLLPIATGLPVLPARELVVNVSPKLAEEGAVTLE